MGLLDAFSGLGIDAPTDPMKQQALQRGLLTMGLGMMQTPGRFGQGVARGGLLGLQAYDSSLQSQRAGQADQLKLDLAQREANRRKQLDDLAGQFAKPGQQFDSDGYGKALMALDPQAGIDWQQKTEKATTQNIYDSEGRQVTIRRDNSAPVLQGAPKLPEGMVMGPNGPQFMPGYIQGKSEIARAGVAPTMMTPIQMQMPDGSMGWVQPGNRPGQAPQIMRDPSTGQPLRPPAKEEKPAPTKMIPDSAIKALAENNSAVAKIDKALEALEKAPDSVGYKGYLPDAALQRIDPGGVEVRAMIADIGSLKLHDRSGAAVTASETPRLRPFIPAATDDPKTIKAKLANFRQEYQSIIADMQEAYGPENGYRPNSMMARTSAGSSGGGGGGMAGPITEARDAIARGAPRAAVIKRLRDSGYDAAGL